MDDEGLADVTAAKPFRLPRLAEDDAIAGERRAAGPILNDLDQLESPRGHLLDYEVDGGWAPWGY
jgi:hypothetical protein